MTDAAQLPAPLGPIRPKISANYKPTSGSVTLAGTSLKGLKDRKSVV